MPVCDCRVLTGSSSVDDRVRREKLEGRSQCQPDLPAFLDLVVSASHAVAGILDRHHP